MPLIGRKLFDGGTPSARKDGEDKTFTISHTNEVFYSEKEYQERKSLYEDKIWSCQCSGHVNLTHTDAMQSEIDYRKRIITCGLVCVNKKAGDHCVHWLAGFGEVWESPILALVHHSFAPLDTIVFEAHQLLMTTLVTDEKVNFTLAKLEKNFEATIIKRYDISCTSSSSDEGKDLTTSISPSSEKENKSRQALITDVFKSDTRRSPRKGHFAKDISLKRKKLKLVPAKYDILLTAENKIVSKVPCENLTRIQKPPNKDWIRLFIRANAVRLFGSRDKLPWVVNEDMVFKYSLKPRISADEEKRMIALATVTSNNLSSDVAQLKRDADYKNVNGSAMANGVIVVDDDDDDVVLADVKKQKRTAEKKRPSDAKRRKAAEKADKRSKGGASRRTKADKSNGVARKPSGMDLFLKKVGKPSANKLKEHATVIIDDDDDDDKPLSTRFTNSPSTKKPTGKSAERSRKSSAPTKKKQATLLELTKKGGGIKLLASPSPSKNSVPSKPRKQPLIVLQMLSLKKEKKFRMHKYKLAVNTASNILTEKQRENLPAEVKDDVMKKWETKERKRKFQAMTPEEKRAYLAEARKMGVAKKSEKYEDQHLPRSKVKALPQLELLGLPDNLPNTSFGDIAMLCEFLHTYHSLLCPKDVYYHRQFHIQSITEAVTSGKTGFGVTRKILVILLQTLLSDDIARDYCELDYPLKQIPVTPEISCELIRVCLRQHDDELDDDSETGSNTDVVDTGMSDPTSRRLFEMELYEMEPGEQVEVLSTLVYRVMNTYAVQTHMISAKSKAATIWKKVIEQGVQRKKEKQEQLQEKKEKEADPNASQKDASSKGATLWNGSPAPPSTDDQASQLDIDLVSRVKQRKLLTERSRREEAERKMRLRKEQEDLLLKQKSLLEREKTKRLLAETRMLADHVKRRVPLGTDRNHSRYWLFCDGVPGLYIEKGWVGDHFDYCTQANPDPVPTSPCKTPRKSFDFGSHVAGSTPGSFASPKKSKSSADDDEDEVPLSQLNSPTKKKVRRSKEEVTWPRSGQNMWMSVDSQEQLDRLVESLSESGVRESKLRRELEKNYDSIMRSINKKIALLSHTIEPVSRRSSLPSDGDELHRNMAVKNMQSLVREACRGGLAQIDEPDTFEQRIATLENVSQFSNALLELFEAIPSKCLNHYMTGISDKKKKSTTEVSEPEVLSDRERVKAERRVSKWKQAVEEATLYSRFCLLLAILNSSIKWEMYRYQRTNARRRGTRNKNYADAEEEADEEVDVEEPEEEEESEEEEEEDNHRRSSRIRDKRKMRFPQDAEEESDATDDVQQRRSTRRRTKRKALSSEDEEVPSKRSRRRPVRYNVDGSSEEEEEDEEEDVVEREDEEEADSNSGESSQSASEESSDEEDEKYDEATLCRSIVEKLMKYKYSEIFRDPVDADDVPDYYEVITDPMCLGDILNRIDGASGAEEYGFEELQDDMRLLLDNAALYNAEGSYEMKQAGKLEVAFVRALSRDGHCNKSQLQRMRRKFKCTTT